MKDPNAKPRFQLRLSTCVLVMVIAGTLIWTNVQARIVVGPEEISGIQGTLFDMTVTRTKEQKATYGFPLDMMVVLTTNTCTYRGNPLPGYKMEDIGFVNGVFLARDLVKNQEFIPVEVQETTSWMYWGIVANSLAAFVLLAAVAVSIEYLIRRSERRRTGARGEKAVKS